MGRPGVLGLPTRIPNALGLDPVSMPVAALVPPLNLTVNGFLAAKGQRFLLEAVDVLVDD